MERFHARRTVLRRRTESALSACVHSLQRFRSETGVGTGLPGVLEPNETAAAAILSSVWIAGIACRKYWRTLFGVPASGVRF